MTKRIEELDSLRGIAALSVVLSHSMLILPNIPTYIKHSPLRLFWAGGEAVILFFLLSGFVLSFPYYNNVNLKYSSYIVKRFFRIYIPYLFWIITTFILCTLFSYKNVTGLGVWFNQKWKDSITTDIILKHMILISDFSTTEFNPVVWSLVHEARISIFFPIFIYLVYKSKWNIVLSIALFMSFISLIGNHLDILVGEGYKNGYIDTIHYTSFFLIGALLAKNINNIKIKYEKLDRRSKRLLISIGFMLYTYSEIGYYLLPSSIKYVIVDWGVSIGVVIIFIFALNSNVFSAVLKNKVLKFLGKISYSMYLCHIPILLTFFNVFNAQWSNMSILFVSFLTIILCSYLSYNTFEKFSVWLGKRKRVVEKVNKEHAEVKAY